VGRNRCNVVVVKTNRKDSALECILDIEPTDEAEVEGGLYVRGFQLTVLWRMETGRTDCCRNGMR
jgi:hypothetical protein